MIRGFFRKALLVWLEDNDAGPSNLAGFILILSTNVSATSSMLAMNSFPLGVRAGSPSIFMPKGSPRSASSNCMSSSSLLNTPSGDASKI